MNNMYPVESVTLGVLVITGLMSITGSLFIRNYLLNKPLGHQTLLDKFLIEVIDKYMAVVVITNFLFFFMATGIPFDLKMGEAANYVVTYALDNWLIWVTSVVIIKHLSVFHPNLVEFHKTDEDIVTLAKMINLALLLAFYGVEHFVIEDHEASAFFQFLTNRNLTEDGQRRNVPLMTTALIAFAVLMIIVLQLRIEVSGVKDQDPNQGEKKALKKNMVRVIVVVVSATMGYVSYALFTVDLKNYSGRIIHGCVVPIFTAAIPPLLFILKNKNMRTMLMKKLCHESVFHNTE